jgi:lipopolysaccharide export system permease protein
MWFIDRYSKFTNKAYGVSVTEMDVNRRITYRVVAAEAWYDRKGRGWVFKDGREMTFDPREITSSEPFAERAFPRFQETRGSCCSSTAGRSTCRSPS